MLASIPILSMIAFSPLLGVLVLLFIRGDRGRLIKTIGIVTTLIPLILAAWLYVIITIRVIRFSIKNSWTGSKFRLTMREFSKLLRISSSLSIRWLLMASPCRSCF